MLSLIKRIFTEPSRFQRPIDPLTRFAKSGYATATSPDAIIAAHICQSLAKDYDGWTCREVTGRNLTDFKEISVNVSHALFHDNEPTIAFYNSYRTLHNSAEVQNVHVASVSINLEAGRAIVETYIVLRKAREEADRVAEKAKRDMAESEKKWNLAERLLKMKRDENGALVPANPVPIETEPKFVPHVLCVMNANELFQTVPDKTLAKKARPKRKKSESRFDSALA